MPRVVAVILTAVALLGGCSESSKPVNTSAKSSVVAPLALNPTTPANIVPERDMQDLVKDLAPTGPQLAALNQAELALKHLARVDLTNPIELELAVSDVLASRACLKAQFSGWALELVTEELPRQALDSYELAQKAEQAYAAFQRNPDLGPLQMLEPLDNGCLATEESMPTVVSDLVEPPSPVAEPALVEDETFIDKDGNPIPAPVVVGTSPEDNASARQSPTQADVGTDPIAVIIEAY